MSPVTGLAGRPGWNPRNTTKIVEHDKLVSFADVAACGLLNFTNKTNSYASKVNNFRTKIMPFWNAKRLCRKSFVPVTRAGVFIWKNCHPDGDQGYHSNRVSPAFHMNASKFLRRRVARRDLGNPASPVDRAHMKRPFAPVRFVSSSEINSKLKKAKRILCIARAG